MIGKSLHLQALSALREGDFIRGLELAEKCLKEDENDFWARFTAAAALGFLDERKRFFRYVKEAEELEPESTYLRYMLAYTALWEKDIEKALYEWTRVIDEPEGWLALDLVEKARQQYPLVEKAAAGEFGDFFVFPDFIDRLPLRGEKNPPAPVQKVRETRAFFNRFKKAHYMAAAIVLLLALSAVVITGIISDEKQPGIDWQKISIGAQAHLVPNTPPEETLHTYKNREQMITDFEAGKKALGQGKINRARYLFRRLIHSNADFKTRQKANIFIDFIPELSYSEFNDNLKPSQIIKEPVLYAGSTVLWEGRVLKDRETDKGREFQISVTDGYKEFLVEAFLNTGEDTSHWQPYKNYSLKQKELDAGVTRPAIFYGDYKGLVGAQKRIYLELRRLWF